MGLQITPAVNPPLQLTGTNPYEQLTDSSAATPVSGALSFTKGTNTGHSVTAIGSNGLIAFAGPTTIDATYDYSLWITEANWINGGKTYDETYWNATGKRVIFSQRNITDGLATTGISGALGVDGTLTGMRNDSASTGVLAVSDNVSDYVNVSVKNANTSSNGVELKLGGSRVDATGWSFFYDPLHDKSNYLGIRNNVIGGFPIAINPTTNAVGIGRSAYDFGFSSNALDVNGEAVATRVAAGTTAPSANITLQVGTHSGTIPAGTKFYLSAPSGGTSAIVLERLSSYNDDMSYGSYRKVDYQSGSVLILGTRDSAVDTDAITIKGANVTIAGTLTVTGGALGTATNNNAAAGNVGEYVSASVVQGSATALTTATPKTVTSISLTAGDWDITAIGSSTGASTGTEFDVAVSGTTNSFIGTVLGDTRCQTPTVSLTGADATLMIPAVRKSISSTTIFYLVVQETFTVGTPAAYGRISARRVR